MSKTITAKFVEFGVGNASFVSTEWEYVDGSEERFKGFRPLCVAQVYIRIWIGFKVYILSTKNGFEVTRKKRKEFKLLLGLGGK